MTQTTRSYQDGPRTNGVNGVAKSAGGASESATSAPPRTLPEICFTLRRKLLALLEEKTDDAVLRGVQDQVRVSMGVIEEAIRTYRWVPRCHSVIRFPLFSQCNDLRDECADRRGTLFEIMIC